MRTAATFASVLALFTALPAQAGSQDRVSFSHQPRAILDVDHVEPGLTRVRIASNAPFTLFAGGVVGPIRTHLSPRIPPNAHTPGPRSACTQGIGLETPIYTAERRTAARRGSVRSQMVEFTISHDALAKPEFTVEAGQAYVPVDRCES